MWPPQGLGNHLGLPLRGLIMRVAVPLVICCLAGVFCVVQFFVPHEYGVKAYEIVHQWVRLMSGFALVLGIGSLLKNHLGRISPVLCSLARCREG